MRTFSANVKTLLARDDVSSAYLVKITRGNTTIFQDTTAAYNITIPGIAGVFLADSGLLTIEAPRLSKAVDRETYRIAYADPEFNKRATFELGLTGAKVMVHLMLFNTTANTLSGIPPGGAMTALADLTVAYGGFVDTQGYGIDPNEGTIIAVIECASPMAALGLTRPFFTSKESMRQRAATDNSFDQVYFGSKQVNYLWGKA